MIRFYKISSELLLISILSGCSFFQTIDEALPDNRADYRKSTTIPPLEVPPDLLKDSIKDELAIPEVVNKPKETVRSKEPTDSKKSLSVGETQVLPQLLEQVQYHHEGDTQWLVLQGEPAATWDRIKAFWIDQGFLLSQEDSRTGVMETEWKENRANLPQSGLRKWVGQVLDSVYDSSTRDKFKVRLERGKTDGTTEVYLTHRGAEEVSHGDNFVWQSRPADPGLEAEMLKRLMVFVGVPATQAQTLIANTAPSVPRASLQRTATGQPSLLVREDFASAWQRTGIALDRLDFSIEDRDREKGIYFVRPSNEVLPHAEKRGFFSQLFGNGENSAKTQEYQIKLVSEQAATRVTVTDKQEPVDNGQIAEKILTLLQEQLR
ncbi:MAG: hypothetical protein BWK79_15580 [Beggiatoa sp. IS2]|nr:MAG: hypothetical protein BWK79_15580 [Beggiatoa sp. IS2]